MGLGVVSGSANGAPPQWRKGRWQGGGTFLSPAALFLSLAPRWPCDSGLASESITTPEYHCQLVGEHVTQAMVVTANKHHLRAFQKH